MSNMEKWLLDEINYAIQNELISPMTQDPKIELSIIILNDDGLW